MKKCATFIMTMMKWIFEKMNNYIVLNKRKNIKHILYIIKNFDLKNTLKNNRTSIWENDDLEISIDKSIIRIMIYSTKDIQHYTNFILQR